MTRTTDDWEALLSECADSWELGDTYADGPRQLLEDGSVIGTIAMHISQHEEVVAAAPEAVAEVVRLRRALTHWAEGLDTLADEMREEGYIMNSEQVKAVTAGIRRILNGDTEQEDA